MTCAPKGRSPRMLAVGQAKVRHGLYGKVNRRWGGSLMAQCRYFSVPGPSHQWKPSLAGEPDRGLFGHVHDAVAAQAQQLRAVPFEKDS